MKKIIMIIALIATSLINVFAQSLDLKRGLVAYYPFNGNANDDSGNGFNGIVNGATLKSNRFGVSNSAYYFNGTDNYIKLGNFIRPTNTKTISLWVKFSTIDDGYREVISNGSRSSNVEIVLLGDMLCFFVCGKINFEDDYNICLKPESIDTINWFHIVVTHEGVNSDMKFYLNGSLIGNRTTPSTIGDSPNLLVGNWNDEEERYFNGSIDDIRIYERALNEIEIKALFDGNFDNAPPVIPIIDPQVSRGVKPIEEKEQINIAGKYYALIIGNNAYQDVAISTLDEPINDATKLYNVLTTQYAFEPQNVTFLKNSTYIQMIEAFDNLSSIITPNDNILVFYAGHGWWDETKKLGYWLPVDAKKTNTAFWIANSRISDYMSSIHSKHTLLIADACFSGSIFKTRSAFNDAQPAINKLYELPSKKAMTSGNLKEVPDRSVFLQFLVKRLEDNKEKYIPSDMLFASFRQAVLNNSPTEPQYGTIQNAGDEGGEFIFIRRDK